MVDKRIREDCSLGHGRPDSELTDNDVVVRYGNGPGYRFTALHTSRR
jgi:hypothetical protein